jgi:hypothetical protein
MMPTYYARKGNTCHIWLVEEKDIYYNLNDQKVWQGSHFMSRNDLQKLRENEAVARTIDELETNPPDPTQVIISTNHKPSTGQKGTTANSSHGLVTRLRFFGAVREEFEKGWDKAWNQAHSWRERTKARANARNTPPKGPKGPTEERKPAQLLPLQPPLPMAAIKIRRPTHNLPAIGCYYSWQSSGP